VLSKIGVCTWREPAVRDNHNDGQVRSLLSDFNSGYWAAKLGYYQVVEETAWGRTTSTVATPLRRLMAALIELQVYDPDLP